jgi:hypothetical protein
MNGSTTLSDEEKQEMLTDAGSVSRKEAFLKARASSQNGSLDDYIEFLSNNMKAVPIFPSRHITEDFRL